MSGRLTAVGRGEKRFPVLSAMHEREEKAVEQHYTIGLDFGSLSCRGLLVCTADSSIQAEEEFVYPHGILTDCLPDGTRLPPLWALQDPGDYVNALNHIVPALMEKSGVSPELVIGLCIDTTASTVVPVDGDLVPLCRKPGMERRMHAWPKMWKHHAARAEAQEITLAAADLPELKRYGGRMGAEFLLPKLLQTMHGDPGVYAAAETFFEYGDWMTSLLTGHEVRSGTYLTCKSMWDPCTGYPKGEFFDPITEKLAFHRGAQPVIAWPGQSVGTASGELAQRLGLSRNTLVSAPQMDGYAGLPGSGIADPGTLAMVLGTSNSFMLLDRETKFVPGICGAVPDSIIRGYTGYAAGQASAGDILNWFTENCVPSSYERKAQSLGMNMHAYLTALAERKKPGESGLVALDWWNGNKSVLNDPGLSGMILGLTLATKPEDIYRALIEATAFGARRILEMFRQAGLEIRSITASGGMAMKNAMLMQIYADVLGVPVAVSPCRQTAAMGSCIFAAAAAGAAKGGYDTVQEAVRAMAPKSSLCYRPDAAAAGSYERLYGEYLTLHDYFGQGENRVMERLKSLG